jgi:hypothetical protein
MERYIGQRTRVVCGRGINGDSSVDIDAIELGIKTIRVGRDEMKSASSFARALSGTLAKQHELCGRHPLSRP